MDFQRNNFSIFWGGFWRFLWRILPASSLHGQVKKKKKKKNCTTHTILWVDLLHRESGQLTAISQTNFLKSYEPWQRFVVHLRIWLEASKKFQRSLSEKTQINFGLPLQKKSHCEKTHFGNLFTKPFLLFFRLWFNTFC